MLQKDPDFEHKELIRSTFDPYQLKICYDIKSDSSELDDEEENMFIVENKQFAEEQPYMTPTRSGYKLFLKQLSSKDLCRRSDITITSTLSMGIFP